MACYDPQTDKIYGCKEGSLTWWHEKGHQNLQHLGISSELGVLITFAILLGWAFLISESNIASLVCLLIVLGIIMFQEVYAWIYAFRRKI